MAEQAYAYVTLIPVAKGFQKEIANQLGGTAGVGKTSGQMAGKNFTSGFGASVKKLAVVAGGALAAAGLGSFFKDSVAQASDLDESINAVQKAYGDYAADVLKLGDGVAERLGLNSVDFNASAVRFSAFAERVVGEGGNVAGFVDNITTRASDFASVFNIEVSEALQVFQSGLSGEAEPLKRFGINLLDSEVSAYALANAIGDGTGALTESEKVQARYGLLLESTAKTAGDFADTSDGLANGQRILKAQFEETQAVIGNALLPIVIDLMNVVKDELLPIMVEFGEWLGSPEGKEAVEDFGTAVMGAVGFLLDLTQWVLENLDLVKNIGITVGVVTAAFKLYSIGVGLATTASKLFGAALLTNPVFLMITAVGLLTFAFLQNDGAVSKNVGTYKKLKDAETDLSYSTRGVADKFKDSAYVQDKYAVKLDETTAAAVRTATGINYVGTEVENADRARFANLPGQLNNVTVAADGTTNALNDTKDATVALTIVEQARERYKQEQINTLGRSTRTLQDFIDGMTRNAQVTAEVNNLTTTTTTTVNGLGNALKTTSADLAGMADAVEELEPQLRTISSIGGVLKDSFEEMQIPELTIGSFRRMAEEVEGLYAVFDENENLLKSYSGYGVENLVPTVDGDMLDVGKITDSLNALQNAGYAGVAEAAFGGSFQQALDTLMGQTTLVNPITGQQRTIGGSDTSFAVQQAIADGFQAVPSLDKSVEELTDAIESLNSQVDERGLTPFASGGFVTGPTPALIGEAGPEVVMPLDRFESMMGLSQGNGGAINYYAAPNNSIDSEQALFQAMRRAKVVANW